MTSQLQETLADLERRVADRTRGLELAAKVAQEIATVRNLDTLLAQSAELIHTVFGLYHTQIYLADSTGRTLTLQAATGSIGEQLLRRGHRLAIKTGSINGTAAAEKRSVVVADTTQSATFLPNPLLPDTRSEVAVPLMVGDRVVGVLDLQHDFVDALSEENLPAFEALAGQLAIAIENARLFVETEQARTEVELYTRHLTGAGWSEFLDGVNRSERIGFNYEAGTVNPLAEALPETHNDHTLAAPIAVNGVTVGQLQLEDENNQSWTSAEIELAKAVAEQVGQQLENLRLLAQAEQYQAEAEAAVRQTTRQGWADYVNNLTPLNSGYGYNQHQVIPLLELNETDTTLTKPLTIRGEMIGELLVEADPDLADDAVELLTAVAEQLSARWKMPA
ncbi:MAG: GAF domain-containing protein [Anaerolineales bacterium]|nr:GAF domain-containing protein [Anaerolineales bacterium]